MILKISQNSWENTCVRISFLIRLQAEAYNFIKKETLTQVFSHGFWGISKDTFFDRTSLVAASESKSLICQTISRTKHMQRGTLLFMAPEQLPGKYPKAKLEDLPNHGSFWQLLLLLHTISMAILNHFYLNDIWLFQLLHAD